MSQSPVPSESVVAPARASREPAVELVRADAFVVRRFELPAGTSDQEVADFVTLQLEELSPFPVEQLYHGHLCASDRRAVLLFAAYRRRFPAEETARWPEAQYVLPEFAGVVRWRFPVDTLVLLRTGVTLTALYFEANLELPVRVASRPLPPDAPADQVERVRGTVRALVGAAERPDLAELTLHAETGPERRAKGLQFTFQAGDGAGDRDVFIPTDDCWTLDVRDPAFIAEQRRRLGFDLVLWRVVLGAAAVMALLMFGEILFGGSRLFAAWLERRNAAQLPEVTSISERDAAVNRLEDFARSGVQPFEMLQEVAALMPGSIRFTRTVSNGATSMEIYGLAPDVGSINAYAASLRAAPVVEQVEVRGIDSTSEGSKFTFAVTFKAGSFERLTTAGMQP